MPGCDFAGSCRCFRSIRLLRLLPLVGTGILRPARRGLIQPSGVWTAQRIRSPRPLARGKSGEKPGGVSACQARFKRSGERAYALHAERRTNPARMGHSWNLHRTYARRLLHKGVARPIHRANTGANLLRHGHNDGKPRANRIAIRGNQSFVSERRFPNSLPRGRDD